MNNPRVSHFPGGFGHGVTVRNLPLMEMHSRDVFWVDSNEGSNIYKGTWARPFKSIDYAVGNCTADNGDVIMVKAGHTEDLATAAAIAADVAGISIIGLGNGGNRPTLTFTISLADVDIDAENVRLSNLIFTMGIDEAVAMIDVNAAGFQIDGCKFLGTASYQPLIWIDLAAAADDGKILGNEFIDATAGATSAISITKTLTNLEIAYNRIWGDYSDACIQNPTAVIATQLDIHHNNLTNLQSDDHCIQLVSACTGVIAYNIVNNNSLADAATAGAIDPGNCACIENYGGRGDGSDTSGVLNPAADS